MSERTQTLKGEQYLVTHSVGQNQSGIRLDRFLMQRYRRRSREQLKSAIDSGAVTVARHGGKHLHLGRIKPSFVLQHRDIVQVLSIRKREPEVDFNYKILYEDNDLVVIHKPANLPVHPAGRFFFNTLLVHLKTQGFNAELQSERSFFLVHRIDKETSGILLLAKTREACNLLTQQFKNRETEKYYLAIGKGAPAEDQFVIDVAMGRIRGSRVGLKMFIVPEEQGGLSALTRFEKIETRTDASGNTYTLMACFPKTGRQHQIRVHAEFAGVPLVGDKFYGLPEEDILALLAGHREHMRSQASPEPAIDEDFQEDAEGLVGSADEDLFASAPEDEEEPSNVMPPNFEIPGPTASVYAEITARLILPRHALHAAGLRFKHPTTGKEMVFETSLPDDLREFFEGINGQPIAEFKTKHW